MINFKIIYKIIGSFAIYRGSPDVMVPDYVALLPRKRHDGISHLNGHHHRRRTGAQIDRTKCQQHVESSRRLSGCHPDLDHLQYLWCAAFHGRRIHTYLHRRVFETMSGFTTTGATIINNVEILPLTAFCFGGRSPTGLAVLASCSSPLPCCLRWSAVRSKCSQPSQQVH